jgi:zinc protease
MSQFPSTPPIGLEPKPWVFPATTTHELSNGLTVAAICLPSLPIVQVRWAFKSGRLHESVERLGSAVLLQTMMRHGTQDLDSAALAEHLDRMGARLGINVSVDSAMVAVSSLSKHLPQALDLVTQVALEPRLPESALERERANAIEIHHHEYTQPDVLTGLALAEGMYGDHPYGRPLTDELGLERTTIEDIRALHGAIVDPARAMLLVVGDIDPDRVIQNLEERFGSAPSGTAPIPRVPARPAPMTQSIRLIERPSAEQSSVGLGMLAVPRKHADFLALRIANQVFGGGASSRLFMELRERQGLTYGAYSSLDCGLHEGDISASLSCAPNKTAQAVTELMSELARMGDGTLSSEDVDHAKRFLVGSFPQRATGLGGVSALVNAAWLHNLPEDIWSGYQTRLDAISLDEVRRVSREWFRPERSCLVVAGTPDAIDAVQTAVKPWNTPISRTKS